jgi:hypothetical protein
MLTCPDCQNKLTTENKVNFNLATNESAELKFQLQQAIIQIEQLKKANEDLKKENDEMKIQLGIDIDENCDFKTKIKEACTYHNIKLSFCQKTERLRYLFINTYNKRVRINFSFQFRLTEFEDRLKELIKFIKERIEKFKLKKPDLGINVTQRIYILNNEFKIKNY